MCCDDYPVVFRVQPKCDGVWVYRIQCRSCGDTVEHDDIYAALIEWNKAKRGFRTPPISP
jgi:hypothetical protein